MRSAKGNSASAGEISRRITLNGKAVQVCAVCGKIATHPHWVSAKPLVAPALCVCGSKECRRKAKGDTDRWWLAVIRRDIMDAFSLAAIHMRYIRTPHAAPVASPQCPAEV